MTCTPATGDRVGTGTTTVTCTAVDGRDNSISDSFDVTVTYRAPHTASATWQDPIDVSGNTFSANHGRTLPIKVRLFVDGAEVRTGSASLTVTPCGGGTGLDLPLTTGGGRWNASLDTSLLVGSCHVVAAWVQGHRGRKLPARAARRRAGQGQQDAGADVDERRDAGVHE